MKTEQKIKVGLTIILIVLIGITFSVNTFKQESNSENSNDLLLSNNILDNTSKNIGVEEIVTENSEVNKQQVVSETDETTTNNDENNENIIDNNEIEIVYDGLTKQELIDKLNRNLNSTLSGTGEIFVNYSLDLGIDPYLAVAIVLHETGCSWDCSGLVKECYNVGGQKGNPGCYGGSYAAFSSLEEGISSYMYNLYNNYYVYGLTTPETINPKYASSTTWASSINNYINKIKAS